MLFTVLKGLFFMEQCLKGTMVWFIRLSSTGRSGAFWGATQNRPVTTAALDGPYLEGPGGTHPLLV